MSENKFEYKVELYDEDNYYDDKMHEQLKKTIITALEIIKPEFDLFVNVSVVSSDEIKNLNMLTRNIDKETDVLSFPMLYWKSPEILENELTAADYDPEYESVFLGDIVLSFEKIQAQAEEYGHSLLRESVYLTLHGILHLLGYDHMISEDKIIMRNREKEIMKILDIEK